MDENKLDANRYANWEWVNGGITARSKNRWEAKGLEVTDSDITSFPSVTTSATERATEPVTSPTATQIKTASLPPKIKDYFRIEFANGDTMGFSIMHVLDSIDMSLAFAKNRLKELDQIIWVLSLAMIV